MKTRILAAILLAATVLPAFADTLIVNNRSEYDIHELYISPARSKNWGPDQLRNDTIKAGARFTINNIPAGVYDLRLIDEDGTECNVENVEFSDALQWTVTNALLERCEKFGR